MDDLLALSERQEKIETICKDYGLDFTIHKIPLYGVYNDNPVKSDYFGLLNDKNNKIINSVKDGYRVTQTDEVVGIVLDGITKFPDLSITKGGSINNGRKMYLQLRVNGFHKFRDDKIERFVTVIDSNDGSSSLRVGIGNKVWSCMNQFYHFKKASQIVFRHSSSIEDKLDLLPHLIEDALLSEIRLMEIYEELADKSATQDLIDTLVHRLVGCDRTMSKSDLEKMSTVSINKMKTLYDHIGKETKTKGLTLWGIHNGVTSWTTHEKSAPRRENGRIESSMLGSNYITNNKSLDFVMQRADLVW